MKLSNMSVKVEIDRSSFPYTYKDAYGNRTIVGNIISFDGAVFEPNIGFIGTTDDYSDFDIDSHNKTLDEMIIHGLDNNCLIGQGGYFYVNAGSMTVSTFTGIFLAKITQGRGGTIEFTRNGKTMQARLGTNLRDKDGAAVFFRRVS